MLCENKGIRKKEEDMRRRKLGGQGIPRTVKGDTRKAVSVAGTERQEQIRKLRDTLLQEDEMNRVSHESNVLRGETTIKGRH